MLWFKNIIIYRLRQPIKLSVKQIEQQLSAFTFTHCGSQDMTKSGWVSPMRGGNDALTYTIPGHVLLCLYKEKKSLPSSVVQQELEGKINKLENKQGRKLHKTEKDILKDEVLQQLLPRAFSRFSQIPLWLDLTNNLVLIDASNAKNAEDCLGMLRKSIGSLPLVPLTMKKPIEITLTEWVRSGKPAAGFTIQNEAELKALLEEGGILRCKKQDLSSDEITVHIESGKLVSKLALDWRERVQFILSDDGKIKRLKFSNTLREQNAYIDRENFAARFDADFMLMTSELASLVADLILGLGGEVPWQDKK
ncbi:MAG: recombination-associated protein RdgC [Sodalis sp. (in: enterobacteria)]